LLVAEAHHLMVVAQASVKQVAVTVVQVQAAMVETQQPTRVQVAAVLTPWAMVATVGQALSTFVI
jgi:hypothetical protein